MSFYVDTSLIVDVRMLAEAHCVNGTAEADGMYVIVVTLKHGTLLKEVCGFYATQTARDAAFVALGEWICTYYDDC